MSFDLEKLQVVAELGEVIRLQNEAMQSLVAFRKARPYIMMPNLAKMVEENMKENMQVLYKELNNLHKPASEQTRYICDDCKMAFLVKLPGGLCDECRAKQAVKPRDYVLPDPSTLSNDDDVKADAEEIAAVMDAAPAADDAAASPQDAPLDSATDAPEPEPGDDAPVDPAFIEPNKGNITESATDEAPPVDEESAAGIADDAEHAASGDKLPIKEETAIEDNPPVDASGGSLKHPADPDEMSDEFLKFMDGASTPPKDQQTP